MREERLLSLPTATLAELCDAAREGAFAGVEIALPAQMPFVRVPEARAALAASGLFCGAVFCDARPNAPGRLRDGVDSLRQATRAAKSLGAFLVPFTLGAHPERDAARAIGLVGRELKAVAALAAEVDVRLGIEIGREDGAAGFDPSQRVEGALRLVDAAGSPKWLGLVVPAALRSGLDTAAAAILFATREREGDSRTRSILTLAGREAAP